MKPDLTANKLNYIYFLMNHDLTQEQVDAIIKRTLLDRKKKREYQKASYTQINLRLRKGSEDLDALDQARGKLTRSAYAQRVLKHHLNIINPTSNLFES